VIERTPHKGQPAEWDWFGDKDTYGVRRGDEVVCYTSRTKRGYERAKQIAEALNAEGGS
jgi:hypothetical protein